MKDIIEQMIEQKELAKREIEKWPEGKRTLLVENKPEQEKTENNPRITYGNLFNYTF